MTPERPSHARATGILGAWSKRWGALYAERGRDVSVVTRAEQLAERSANVTQSGVFERPIPVPSSATFVVQLGLLGLLGGRLGWLLFPLSPAEATGVSGAQAVAEPALPAGGLLTSPAAVWLLAVFYASCIALVSFGNRRGAARLAGPLAWVCSAVLFGSGALHCATNRLGVAQWAEQLATAALPLVWSWTRHAYFLRPAALRLARAAVVLALLAHAYLFFDWQGELWLLGRLLVTSLGFGASVTHGLMLGVAAVYASLGLAVGLAGWVRSLDRAVLGSAVTLGAFTAGIRICLGLEPGFFEASAGHWLLSTLLGAGVGCLPLFMALVADQRVASRVRHPEAQLRAPGASRHPGPLSAA